MAGAPRRHRHRPDPEPHQRGNAAFDAYEAAFDADDPEALPVLDRYGPLATDLHLTESAAQVFAARLGLDLGDPDDGSDHHAREHD